MGDEVSQPTFQQTTYPNANVLDVDFHSYEAWVEWLRHPRPDRINEIVEHTHSHGLLEPLTRRYFRPFEITWSLDNVRESGIAGGLNSRMRATLYALHSCLGDHDRSQLKIYAAEAVTDFALLMRSHFPKFLGSEYTSDPEVAEDLFPIPNEDLLHLSFKEASFDVVTTNEVLEHVPSLDTALAEIARVLKTGGWHIGTCPFLYNDQKSQLRTVIENGQFVHLLEPEWHGDPMGTGGSLVFEIAGWDVLERAKVAGFSQAFWKYIQSPSFGIASHPGGVFVLCLQK